MAFLIQGKGVWTGFFGQDLQDYLKSKQLIFCKLRLFNTFK